MSGKENIRIAGINELSKEIQEVYSSPKASRAMNQAVNAGGEIYVKNLTKELGKHKRTGHFQKDVVVRKSRKNSRRNMNITEVGWSTEHQRHRVTHLLQWGFNWRGIKTKPVKPISYDFLGRVNKNSENEYLRTIESELKKYL